MMCERVVMFHIGRSGSTVLGDLMDQHDDLCWLGELYLPIFLAWQREHGLNQIGARVDPLAYLQQRLADYAANRFVGWEVKFFHLQKLGLPLADYVAALHEMGVTRFIVLRRKNRLRKIVSSLIAQERGRFHQQAEDDQRPFPYNIHINPHQIAIDFSQESLLTFLTKYETELQELTRLLNDSKTLWLTYEEDVMDDPLSAYQTVCRFLKLPPQAVVVHYGRINPYSLREMICNFAEIEAYLQGTPFAWMVAS